jgi:predicted dehydrogenase
MQMMVNAGDVPADSWVQDPERGGGRIIGEACHFIDLLCHLAASPAVAVSAIMVGPGPAVREDKMSIVLRLADGSIAAVSYFANGSKSYPKETLMKNNEEGRNRGTLIDGDEGGRNGGQRIGGLGRKESGSATRSEDGLARKTGRPSGGRGASPSFFG